MRNSDSRAHQPQTEPHGISRAWRSFTRNLHIATCCTTSTRRNSQAGHQPFKPDHHSGLLYVKRLLDTGRIDWDTPMTFTLEAPRRPFTLRLEGAPVHAVILFGHQAPEVALRMLDELVLPFRAYLWLGRLPWVPDLQHHMRATPLDLASIRHVVHVTRCEIWKKRIPTGRKFVEEDGASQEQFLERLLKLHPGVDVKDLVWSPLYDEEGADSFPMLAAAGWDTQSKSIGSTALHYAVADGSYATVMSLLKAGALHAPFTTRVSRYNQRYSDDAKKAMVAIVRASKQEDLDINSSTCAGKTITDLPLFWGQSITCYSCLLSLGLKFPAEDRLRKAVVRNNPNLRRNLPGFILLLRAGCSRYESVVEKLLEIAVIYNDISLYVAAYHCDCWVVRRQYRSRLLPLDNAISAGHTTHNVMQLMSEAEPEPPRLLDVSVLRTRQWVIAQTGSHSILSIPWLNTLPYIIKEQLLLSSIDLPHDYELPKVVLWVFDDTMF